MNVIMRDEKKKTNKKAQFNFGFYTKA